MLSYKSNIELYELSNDGKCVYTVSFKLYDYDFIHFSFILPKLVRNYVLFQTVAHKMHINSDAKKALIDIRPRH